MNEQTFANGMTVAELKHILSTCGDTDENGAPRKVWIEFNTGIVSLVHGHTPLNLHFVGKELSCDILLSA